MSEAEAVPAVTPTPAPEPKPNPVPPAPEPAMTELKAVEAPRTVVEVKLEQPKRSVVEFALVGIVALILGVVATAVFVNFVTSVVKLDRAKVENTELTRQLEESVEARGEMLSDLQKAKTQFEAQLEESKQLLREEQERSIALAQSVKDSRDKALELSNKYKNLEDILIRVKRGEVSVEVDKNYVPPGADPPEETVLEKIEETLEEVEEAEKEEKAEPKKGKELLKPWTWLRKSNKDKGKKK